LSPSRQTLAPYGLGRPHSTSARSGIKAVPGAATVAANGGEDKGKEADFGLEYFENHIKFIKLALEVDIKIVARVKGDVAIGLLTPPSLQSCIALALLHIDLAI
jgi:hypothetical protein